MLIALRTIDKLLVNHPGQKHHNKTLFAQIPILPAKNVFAFKDMDHTENELLYGNTFVVIDHIVAD